MNCNCIEALTREHKNILRIADVLESMSKRAQAYSEHNQDDAGAILRIVREFGDGFHQAKEESALFPIFTAVCDASQQAAVRHMVFEHGQDRAVMTDNVLTTTPETLVTSAARVMVDRKIGCLPVIEGAVLIGILSESDIVLAVAQGSL